MQEVDVYDPENTGPDLKSASLVTEDAAYFTLHFDERVDTSHLPDGTGIFCLPYETDDTQNAALIHPEKLYNAYPMARDVQTLRILQTADGTVLLLTRQQGYLCLTELALPAERGGTMQQLAFRRLLPMAEDAHWRGEVLFDDCLLLFAPGNTMLLLEQNETGRFAPVLCADTSTAETLGMQPPYSHYADCVWDGERLAIAHYKQPVGFPECTDVYVAVFDADGLQYMGEITSTLSRNRGADSNGQVRPSEDTPLTLRWAA